MMHLNNAHIFWALMQRNMLLLKKNFISKLLDGLFTSIAILVVAGYLLPLVGIPSYMIGPFFINIALNTLFSYGFAMAMNILKEIKNGGRIYYLFTLPVPKKWVLASYITNFALEVIIITIPLLLIGAVVLGDKLQIIQTNWLLLPFISMATIVFFGIFMLLIGIHYEQKWFFANIWPRRLSPMYSFGATFYMWKSLYAFAPTFALITLLNPLVYISEGLRNALIGGDRFLSGWLCCGALFVWSLLACITLQYSLKKRMDPV